MNLLPHRKPKEPDPDADIPAALRPFYKELSPEKKDELRAFQVAIMGVLTERQNYYIPEFERGMAARLVGHKIFADEGLAKNLLLR